MKVEIKLEFANRWELQRMIDLLWKIDCPMKDVKCNVCRYHRSCLKLRDIRNELESVIIYDN